MNEENIVSEQSSETVQTIPLAYHETCMERNARNIRNIIIAWVVSVAAIVGGFVYFWLQYDFVSTTEYSGVYNLTDSKGNVISADITPEDIITIMEVLADGESAENGETK